MNDFQPIRSVNEDDIEHLRRNLHMPGFTYVDFSAQREREQALARWALLRELEQAVPTGHDSASQAGKAA